MSIAYGENKDFHSVIERLKNGDKNAFVEIYKKYSASIAFLCQKFCDSKEDAEEVVQDTFVIAYKKAADLRGDTLPAYLRKIAIHECFRKRNKGGYYYEYTMHSDKPTEDYPELNESFLPEEALQNKERQVELLRIINQLPKNRREMVYLYYYADLSTEEIARLYDCTNSTVRNTLSAARGTIKNKLAGKDKKTAVKAVVLLPLSALFFMEEEAFAANYISTAAPSVASANIAGEIAYTTAISTKGYVAAACVVAVCIVSAAVYIALQPAVEEYNEPIYEVYIPATREMADGVMEDIVEEIQLLEPMEEHTSSVITEPEQVEEVELIPGSIEEAVLGEVVESGLVEEFESEPIHIDRTSEILEALAVAANVGDVEGIINYYGFRFATQIHLDMLLYRFYVLNEGNGDILIGIAAYEDGTSWRMRFAHFAGGQMPTDILHLLRFME